jgi:hypothetical protein
LTTFESEVVKVATAASGVMTVTDGTVTTIEYGDADPVITPVAVPAGAAVQASEYEVIALPEEAALPLPSNQHPVTKVASSIVANHASGFEKILDLFNFVSPMISIGAVS